MKMKGSIGKMERSAMFAGGLVMLALCGLSACRSKTIPSLVNLPEAEAQTKLAAAGMRLGNTTVEAADETMAGKVVSQVPPVGAPISTAASGSVDIVVGGVATPKLINSSPEDAAMELKRAGLALGDVRAVPKLTGHGTVSDQSVAFGTAVRRGTTVDITVTKPMVVDILKSVFLAKLRSSGQFKKLDSGDQQKIEQALR